MLKNLIKVYSYYYYYYYAQGKVLFPFSYLFVHHYLNSTRLWPP